MKWRLWGPVLLALGIVVSSTVAARVPAAMPQAMAGPVVMALVLLIVAGLDRWRFGGSRAVIGAAVILTAAILLAGWLTTRRDPAQVVDRVWLYGAGASAALSLALGRGRASGSAS
ncbi:hypothetical protein KDL67_16825 [bacterium]|nr:hypothetical protein [bacterium]